MSHLKQITLSALLYNTGFIIPQPPAPKSYPHFELFGAPSVLNSSDHIAAGETFTVTVREVLTTLDPLCRYIQHKCISPMLYEAAHEKRKDIDNFLVTVGDES
jgi:hypothetical protein